MSSRQDKYHHHQHGHLGDPGRGCLLDSRRIDTCLISDQLTQQKDRHYHRHHGHSAVQQRDTSHHRHSHHGHQQVVVHDHPKHHHHHSQHGNQKMVQDDKYHHHHSQHGHQQVQQHRSSASLSQLVEHKHKRSENTAKVGALIAGSRSFTTIKKSPTGAVEITIEKNTWQRSELVVGAFSKHEHAHVHMRRESIAWKKG